jgi:two-component system chemotaxis response regulator CheB
LCVFRAPLQGQGFKMIAENGGESIVQDCEEAEFSVMPRSAIEIYKNHKVYTLNHIIKKINNYVNKNILFVN